MPTDYGNGNNFRPLVRLPAYNFDLPEPAYPDGYKVTNATVVDSARNVKGYVVGSVIRSDVLKVELRWNYLPADVWASILQKFLPAYGGSFYNTVEVYYPPANGWVTRKMYVNDRSSPTWRRDPKTGIILGYVEPELHLIEV